MIRKEIENAPAIDPITKGSGSYLCHWLSTQGHFVDLVSMKVTTENQRDIVRLGESLSDRF